MRRWRHVLGCDLRALASLRVALALVLLWDLCGRAADLRAHYTDDGVLTRAAIVDATGDWPLSLHALSGAPEYTAALFVLGGVAAILLGVGYRTRAMTIASWLLLASLHARNPLVLHEGDTLLLIALLLGAFLPLGARYSVDAALCEAPVREHRLVTPATAALLVQVTLVYFVAALRAGGLGAGLGGVETSLPPDLLGPVSRTTTTPVVWPLAGALAADVLLAVGVVAPLLAFSPLLHLPARLVLVASLLAAHLGGAIALGLGGYPLAGAVALLAFVPSPAWDWLARRAGASRREGLRIYFDGDCGFCRKTCLLLRTFLLLGDVPIRPAQEVAPVHALMRQHDSWVVYDHDGRAFVRWHAVLLLLRRSPVLAPLGRLLTAAGMGRWGDCIYAVVARHRGRLSAITAALLPYGSRPAGVHPAAHALVGLWLALAVGTNALSLAGHDPWGASRSGVVPHALGLVQSWHVLGTGGVVVARPFEWSGRLADATVARIGERDARTPARPEPAALARLVRGDRWRRLLTRLAVSPPPAGPDRLTGWVCAAWNERVSGPRLERYVVRAGAPSPARTGARDAAVGSRRTLLAGACPAVASGGPAPGVGGPAPRDPATRPRAAVAAG